MSVFPGDVIIKQVLELGIDDIKKNSWIIDDIFSDFITDPFLSSKYGQKEINNAKDFILNNNIPVIMGLRLDKEEVPCITIQVGSSQEADEFARLSDLSDEVVELSPDQIGKPIKFIVPSFQISSYDVETGEVFCEVDLSIVRSGMVLIDPKNGVGYIINTVNSNSLIIDTGLKLKTKTFAIIPQFQVYRARREMATFREVYNIGCHAHGDPSFLIYLNCLVTYVLLRYRESLLEGRNFQISSISSSEMIKNTHFSIENVYSRFITLKGVSEFTWIKSPTRVIESVNLGDINNSGIKIISKKKIKKDSEVPLWETVDDNEL